MDKHVLSPTHTVIHSVDVGPVICKMKILYMKDDSQPICYSYLTFGN